MTRTLAHRIRHALCGWLPAALDIVFPRSALERAIPRLTVAHLHESCPPARESKGRDVHALFAYTHPTMRALIWLLKYRGNRHAVMLAADALFELIAGDVAEHIRFRGDKPPVVIPIPLGEKRLRERGFNQMSLVLREMSLKNTQNKNNAFFEPREDVLEKIKDTKPQTLIKDKKTRRHNLTGCFAVTDTGAISQRHIILIDDVTTTGATFDEARSVLLAAGAASVVCYAVAH